MIVKINEEKKGKSELNERNSTRIENKNFILKKFLESLFVSKIHEHMFLSVNLMPLILLKILLVRHNTDGTKPLEYHQLDIDEYKIYI